MVKSLNRQLLPLSKHTTTKEMSTLQSFCAQQFARSRRNKQLSKRTKLHQ